MQYYYICRRLSYYFALNMLIMLDIEEMTGRYIVDDLEVQFRSHLGIIRNTNDFQISDKLNNPRFRHYEPGDGRWSVLSIFKVTSDDLESVRDTWLDGAQEIIFRFSAVKKRKHRQVTLSAVS